VVFYDIQPGDGVGLFWDKHTRLLTYLLAPDPHGGFNRTNTKQSSHQRRRQCTSCHGVFAAGVSRRLNMWLHTRVSPEPTLQISPGQWLDLRQP